MSTETATVQLRYICISKPRYVCNLHKPKPFATMLHIKKLMGMHNKETYMQVCVRIDMFIHKKCTYSTHMHTCSWEISELHCNQLRLATLQEGFVWCLFEVISSFCLFREANSGLQMTNYFSQRYRFTST